MRSLLWILLAIATQAGAQNLYLRTGGPTSTYRITSVTCGSGGPVVAVENWITSADQHDLNDGDVINISFVLGEPGLNGVRRVKNVNQSAGTLELEDIGGGQVGCLGSFDASLKSGYLGKVAEFAMNPHPRIFLPQSGPLLDRSKDPDGTGPAVAPAANSPAYRIIMSGYSDWITSGCDGVTPELCTKEEAHIRLSNGGVGLAMQAMFELAYAWYVDNSKTGFLNAAKYYFRNFHRLNWSVYASAPAYLPNFACDDTAEYCGVSSTSDQMSETLLYPALAYDLLRNELTLEDRAHFARAVLNSKLDGCTNSLQQQPGTVIVHAGTARIEGSGLDKIYAVGDYGYIKTVPKYGAVGKWFDVTGVSPDGLYIDVVFKGSRPATTISNADHYKVMPWTDTTCGAWFGVGGHHYFFGAAAPRALVKLASSMPASTAGATETIEVQRTVDLPAPPFEAQIEMEVVRITEKTDTTLTVVRGQKYSAPTAHRTGTYVIAVTQTTGTSLSTLEQNAMVGPYSHNLGFEKAVGYLVTACVLAGDDPRATEYCRKAWNSYYDFIYPTFADRMAPSYGGFSNVGYAFGRYSHQVHAGLVGRHAFSGVNDIFGEHWLNWLQTPFQWSRPDRWDITPYDGTDTYVYPALYYVPMAASLFPGDPRAERAVYWYKNLSGMHQEKRYAGYSSGRRPHIAAYLPEDAATSDFRGTMPPWEFNINKVGDPEVYGGLLFSRSGWNTGTESMLFADVGFSRRTDHTVYSDSNGTGTPGMYNIWKGGRLLAGQDTTSGTGSSTTISNWMEVGGGNLTKSATNDYLVDRNAWSIARSENPAANDEYLYVRANLKDVFIASANIERAHRHFLHLRKVALANGVQTGDPSVPEYVVVFDDFITGAPKQFKTRQSFHLKGVKSPVMDPDTGCSYTMSFQADTAMISTKVLFPDNSAPSCTQTTTAYSRKFEWDWGSSGKSAQMIQVHRIAAGTTDAMPAVRLLSTIDSGFRGLEADDGNNSRAVVFGMGSNPRRVATFSTTFSGMGRAFVAGLEEGLYEISRNGASVAQNVSVDASGTLWFPAEGGASISWAVTKTGGKPVLTVNAAELGFDYTPTGGLVPAQRTFDAYCSSDTCQVSVEKNCSWAAVSPASGATPVQFTVTPTPDGLPAGLHICRLEVNSPDAASSPITVEVQLKVADATTPPSAPQIITDSMPSGVPGAPYSATLIADGGTPPYTWSIDSGWLPLGLALRPEGEVAGVPTQQESAEATFKVTDSATPPQSATRTLRINIDPPGVDSLTIRATGATRDRVAVRYGRMGLQAQSRCTLELSDTQAFTTIRETVQDTGGPSRRVSVLGAGTTLNAGQTYYARALCGSDTASTAVTPRATAAADRVQISFAVPSTSAATQAKLEYGGTPALGTATTQLCGGGACSFAVPTGGAPLYVRRTYLDGSGGVVARSAIELVMP